MKSSREEQPMKKGAINKAEQVDKKRSSRKAMKLFLAVIAFYLCFIIAKPILEAPAITLPEPIGIVYFEEPDEQLMAHENYHLKVQIENEGAVKFYSRYILGRGCIYEAEAGEGPDIHGVCKIPWMRQPNSDQIASESEILAWYRNYVRSNPAVAIR